MNRIVAILSATLLVIGGSVGQAATFIYNRTTSNTSGTVDQWSAGTNWDSTPVGATDTTLTIGIPATQLPAGATIFTTNNISGDFQLSKLNFTYGSVSLSPRPIVAISGNRLEFVSDGATTPLFSISATGAPSSILTISNPLLLTNNLTIGSTSDATLSGIISGPGSLTKTNSGALTLSGANTYGGGTTFSNDALIHINNSGVGGASSAIGTGTLTINALVTLTNTSNNTVTLSTNNPQIWASDFSFFAGTIGLTPTRSLDLGAGAVTMTANRVINVSGFDDLGQPTLTVGGAIGDGGSGFSLTKENFGTLVLTGASTYSGGTTIARGAINTSNIGNTGAPGLGTGNITIGTGSETATLRYTGTGEISDKVITLGGTGFRMINRRAGSTGLLKLTADLVEIGTDPKTLVLASNTPEISEFAGKISGSSVSVRVDDLGTWILSGANTFTTKVVISSGTLSVSSLNSVVGGSPSSNLGAPTTVANGTIDLGGPFSPGVSVHGAAALRYTGTGETTDRVINLVTSSGGIIEQAGTGLLKFTSNVIGSQSLGLAGSTVGRGEFAGLIDGVRSVSKSGSGTWMLSAANTYTGETRVFDGTLLINGDQSAATGAIFVHQSNTPGEQGLLGGTGTIGGAVTVTGGMITAGEEGGVGTLTLNGAATFVGTIIGDDDGNLISTNPATYSVDISGAMGDKLVIGGALDLTHPLDQITFNGSPDGTSSYLLATYASLNGTFNIGTAPPGYQLIYGTNELILAPVPVPEPGIFTLGRIGIATLLFARRSRRSS